jgi:epoxyqueuosine reductase
MEKAWAQVAGLGWVGKNGCLITLRHGSWVLLATLIVDRELAPDSPHPERCGSCQACLPACPTGAIPEPGFVDARRCISFQTIERRGPVPEPVAERLGPWIFGCDDCQTCCPWNGAVAVEGDPELTPRPARAALDLDAMLRLSEEDYRRAFWGTALARARHDGLLRNALLAAGLAGDGRRAAAVAAHARSPHQGVRAAARWALARLGADGLKRGTGPGKPLP